MISGGDRPAAAADEVKALRRRLAEVERERDALRSQTEARLRATFDDAPVGIVEVDEDDRFVSVNRRFCEILGYAPAEVLGRTVHDLTAPEDRAMSREVNGAMHRGERRRFAYEKRYLRADGSPLWVHVTISAFRDEAGRYHAIGTLEDDGRRKAAEAERERIVAELRDADRRKDEFLGMLSHELRNPLAPIRNSLYLLERAEPGGPQARRAMEIASRQVAHLARLVDDLLDVTRIARGKIELHRVPVDLAALARGTAEDHRASMQARGLELSLDVEPGPLVVTGDETRLVQVLGNLLSNAAKFTPPGGRVALTVAREPGAAVVRLRDTGAGIDPALAVRIFEPFTQAKQTLARSEGGLGLGLALVKSVVELHGGTVAVASDGPGRGSAFTVRLPLAIAAAVEEPRAAAAP